MKSLILSLVFVFTAPVLADAVNPELCPESFSFKISKISAYKSSIYDDVAGWEQANGALAADAGDKTWQFELSTRTAKACYYKAAGGESVKIFTAQVYDREDNDTLPVSMMSVYFKAGETRLSLLPSIALTENGIEIYRYHSQSRGEIHTPLRNYENKFRDFPVGLGFFEIL